MLQQKQLHISLKIARRKHSIFEVEFNESVAKIQNKYFPVGLNSVFIFSSIHNSCFYPYYITNTCCCKRKSKCDDYIACIINIGKIVVY